MLNEELCRVPLAAQSLGEEVCGLLLIVKGSRLGIVQLAKVCLGTEEADRRVRTGCLRHYPQERPLRVQLR